MAGFHFKETMAGTWRREGAAGGGKMHFTITVTAPSLRQHARDSMAELQGRVHVEGFAQDAAILGVVTISPLRGKLIRYEFDFTGDDGKAYHFRGQKDVSLLDLVRTMTFLPGEIVDETRKVVGRAELEFDKRALPKFLASFRPHLF
jgi:hypothetical protein